MVTFLTSHCSRLSPASRSRLLNGNPVMKPRKARTQCILLSPHLWLQRGKSNVKSKIEGTRSNQYGATRRDYFGSIHNRLLQTDPLRGLLNSNPVMWASQVRQKADQELARLAAASAAERRNTERGASQLAGASKAILAY